MIDETCEGFTNYATFSVAVTIDNESRSAHDWVRSFVWECEEATEVPEALDDSHADNVLASRWLRATVGDRLRDYFEAEMPENLPGFYGSLLRAGFGLVNWTELAEHWADAEWREAQS